MSEPQIRVDQLTGMRVLLAPDRSERPQGMDVPGRERRGSDGCPFCAGHEDRTPSEVYAVRPEGGEPNGPGWIVRSVPNMFPALSAEEKPPAEVAADREAAPAGSFSSSADPLHASARTAEPDLFVSRQATGAHEVIINSPEHLDSLADLDADALARVVEAWRERMRAHERSQYVQLIVNEGLVAGASLEHTHAQMYALGFVPAAIARERERAASYAERTTGGSLLLDVLVEEIRRAERLVAVDEEAALICPWAARLPYEMRIVPRQAQASFAESEIGAGMLATAMRVMRERFGDIPPLNLWIRTAPPDAEHFHWHIDLAPRLQTPAGFELGTDIHINSLSPEAAAAELREYV